MSEEHNTGLVSQPILDAREKLNEIIGDILDKGSHQRFFVGCRDGNITVTSLLDIPDQIPNELDGIKITKEVLPVMFFLSPKEFVKRLKTQGSNFTSAPSL
jgi:hypothetical protein